MVRHYKRKTGARSYRNYSDSAFQKAVKAVKTKKLSFRKASTKYSIPHQTLFYYVHLKPEQILFPQLFGYTVHALLIA